MEVTAVERKTYVRYFGQFGKKAEEVESRGVNLGDTSVADGYYFYDQIVATVMVDGQPVELRSDPLNQSEPISFTKNPLDEITTRIQ